MKTVKWSKNSKRAGNTLTEVVVSLAVLMLLAAMVSRSFLAGWQLTQAAVRRIQDMEALQEAVYLGEPVNRIRLNAGKDVYLEPEGKEMDPGNGQGGFYAEGTGLYRYEKEEKGSVLYRLEREKKK